MLTIVKKALRIATDAFDDELTLLIEACLEEMRGVNVIVDTDKDGVPTSAQVRTAVVCYCKWQFGDNDNKEQFEAIYHEKLAQLKTMNDYTDWSVAVDG